MHLGSMSRKVAYAIERLSEYALPSSVFVVHLLLLLFMFVVFFHCFLLSVFVVVVSNFFFFLMLHFHSERHQEWHSNIIILYSYIQIINIGMMRSVASVESISGYMMRFYSPLAYTYIHYYYHTYISCSICCIYNFTCVCVYGLAP